MSDVKKAVIPAAGWGTRFLPIVKAVPKSMLPIGWGRISHPTRWSWQPMKPETTYRHACRLEYLSDLVPRL